jgi:dTDP-4-amino-4,6-dideoxygalactose transaminase
MLQVPSMDLKAQYRRQGEEITAAMRRVAASGWYILGSEVAAFESEFSRELGYAHAAGVANGTDALALCLMALGIQRGDKVATVSHTAVATVAAIEMVGAHPVLVDIDPATYTMDPVALERSMRAFAPVAAVIAVHLYGHPADLAAITAITRAHGAKLIEDCAQAHGAITAGRAVGSLSHAAAFSFYPTKNLGALGDGGLVVTEDAECIRRVRAIREYGWGTRYISDVPGINSRLDELQAAVLRVKLPTLKPGNARRAQIAAAYQLGLENTGLILPTKRGDATHVYHQYVIRSKDRDPLRARLRDRGVATNIHYPAPVHRQPGYKDRLALDPAGLRETEQAAQEVLSLPMYPELTDEAVGAVIDAIQACV